MTRLPVQPDAAPAAGCSFARRRPGFTLVEMLVSLAVLAVALTVMGVVFTVTTETTRQAAAYAEAQNWLRQFMAQIEEDLKYCEPSNSVLVLVGRTQPAGLTQADLDAGKYYRVLVGNPANVGGFRPVYDPNADPDTNQYSDPRADLLMFFSNRSAVSQAPPRNPQSGTLGDAALKGAKFSPILLVYGHAALDEARFDGNRYVFANNLRHIAQPAPDGNRSILPVTRWHLSRRATIIQGWPSTFEPGFPGNVQFSQNACRALARCEEYADGQPMPGDAAFLDLPLFLEMLGPHANFSLGAALGSPYVPFGFGWPSNAKSSINSLMYAAGTAGPGSYHHVATVIERPPAELQSNLGVHMLPGCAWFQVEFLMPEDPRNSVNYDDPTPLDPSQHSERFDMPRWTEVKDGETYVFVPDTAANRELVSRQINAGGFPSGRLATFARLDQEYGVADPFNALGARRVRMWPYAIRVTVRVFDPKGRLKEPIVRSIVHRFE